MINDNDAPDDIDRLYVRLQPLDPPADLTRRILGDLAMRTPLTPQAPVARSVTRPARATPWRWIAGIAAVAFVLLSIRLGTALDSYGTLDLINEAFNDTQSTIMSPGEYASTIVGAIPWVDFLLTAGAFTALWYSVAALIPDRLPDVAGGEPHGVA